MSHARFRAPILLFSLPLLACSCTQFTHFNAKPLDVDVSAASLTQRRLSRHSWTLQSLTEYARTHHPDIAVARAKYALAVAAVRSAGERPNPTAALSPQIVTPWTKWIAGTYGIDFDWTFETAGKRNQRQLAAHTQVGAAAANVIDTTWKVHSAVRKAFLDVYTAGQRSKLLSDAIAQQAELLAALDDRVKAGSESRSATTQARLLQAQMRLQAAENARLAAIARASLAEALGLGLQGIDGADFSFAAFESSSHSVPGKHQALTHRADVLAALAEYATAEANLRLEIAKQYPDLHLNPGYALDAGENKWTLGIGLTLPILNHNQGAIGEAEAKRKQAAATFDAVQAKALAEYDRAATALAATTTKLATTHVLLDEQTQQVASEERLLQAGSGDRAALLSAQVERATTRIARIDALADIQAAVTELEAATQTHTP
ncbi:MAG: TolC family protein [Verrucomicrobia bacterium]|nr:MAG: TolC family protein [Verrucomicrobiota bacterium]